MNIIHKEASIMKNLEDYERRVCKHEEKEQDITADVNQEVNTITLEK